MKCPFCIKVCSKCGRILVANNKNFYKDKSKKYGLNNRCKICDNKRTNERHKINRRLKNKSNPFDNIDINKTWNRCPFCIKVCTNCGKILVANSNNFARDKNKKYGLEQFCKECKHKNDKQWRKENQEYLEQYREDNKEEIKERYKQWRKNNPEKEFNNRIKRRQREENQGRGITKEQWLEMFEFFEWKCAYSGEKLSGSVNHNRTIDHIVPLNKNGENEIWNLVPMFKSYNSSKQDKDMIEWYTQQEFYSEERLNKIYEWIEYARNKWNI